MRMMKTAHFVIDRGLIQLDRDHSITATKAEARSALQFATSKHVTLRTDLKNGLEEIGSLLSNGLVYQGHQYQVCLKTARAAAICISHGYFIQ